MDIVSLIIGLIIGIIIVFFIKKDNSPQILNELDEVKQDRDAQREKNELHLSEIRKIEAAYHQESTKLESLNKIHQQKTREFEQFKEKMNELNSQAQQLLSNNATLKTQLQAEKNLAEEKLSTLRQSKEELNKNFKALAQEVFEEQSKNQSQVNKEKLDLTLKPLREQIQNFSKKVQDHYEVESKERHSLVKEISQLKDLNLKMSEDALQLTKALKGDNKAQGTWGEMILERVLEASGLRKDREYFTQSSYSTDDGKRYQPDVIVQLPDEKQIIIDSKVSLISYEAYCSETEENLRLAHQKTHLESVKNHIKQLSEKSYEELPEINSLDFVLLFMPIEGAFRLAVEADENLFLDAYKKNIMLVSPSTLLITLRTINKIWQFEYQNKNTQEIVSKAEALYNKFVGYVENFQRIGKNIDQAKKAYNDAEGQLISGRGNLINNFKSLETLGIKSKKQIAKDMQLKAGLIETEDP